MLEVDKVVSVLCGELAEGIDFKPSDTNLTDYFVDTTKGEREEDQQIVIVDEWEESANRLPILPTYPLDKTVVAIDSTSFTLGHIPDGLIGAVRNSVIVKQAEKVEQSLELYGPFLVPINNQNKDSIYRNLFKTVYGKETDASAPDCAKTLDRARNLLERHIQLEVAKKYRDSLILLDGSLIGGTVANPEFFVRKIIDYATGNGNSIVAISKFTGLTLQQSRRSILSLLDGIHGPCYVKGVKDHISQNKDRYLGDIYVTKLTLLGEPFRVDLPTNASLPHMEILSQTAGLAGEYGYPEELKLAHMTCVFSSIEIIELQAAAIALYGLVMKEEFRQKIFPL